MVCKEEVFSWFQNLRGSKRIEAMCCFLNMCYPLELRFYGTCLEDLGRKDFYIFKEDEIKANDLTEVLKIRNIHEHSNRSKLIVMLSLLNSSNTICAGELFKVLSEEIKIEILASMGIFSDFKLVEHYLLILTLAQHHPAFNFEQQTFLTNLSISLENYVTELYSKVKCEESYLPSSYVPGRMSSHGMQEKVFSSIPHSYRHTSPRCSSESQHNQVQITSLKVKPPHKKLCLRIRVAWENNKITDAFKTPHDLLVFHQKLVQMFPTEAKNNNQDKCIPSLPHVIGTWNKQSILTDSVANSAAEYIQQLNSRLPSYIIESEFFRNFFTPSYPNRAVLSRNSRTSESGSMDMPQRNSRLRSLTIYNSRMSDNSPKHHPENRQKTMPMTGQRKQYENGSNTSSRPSPVNSPIESPLSSPYASPLNSETNSRAPSPWNAATSNPDRAISNNCPESSAVERIHPKEDQWNTIQNYKFEELQAMPVQELESLSIIKDAGIKSSKDTDSKSLPNGIIGCYIPKSAVFLKSGPLLQANSNDSSPVCSEYSSPPQSPSPGETCNQSSSLSSGNEENIEKRPLSKALTEMCKVDETGPNIPDSPFKRTDDDSILMKGGLNRSSVSVIPFAAVPYSSIVTPIPPPQSMKPPYLPITCRTNNVPQNLSPGTVVFDNQFSRVPLPSALTFLPGPQRSHAATPDRVLSPSSLPISTVTPFPVVTSGCSTVPSATCSFSTHRSSNNVTAVTHSGASSNRYTSKSNVARDSDMINKQVQQTADTPYATSYILNTSAPLTAVSCSCFTTNSARPSPAPSPSIMSPGATAQPSAVPVSMSYLGMPYLFHSIPFLQTQTPANGFVPQPGIANSGQNFSFTLPNGMTAISPELIYPGQTFTLQSPSTQSTPCPVATPASQCYGAFPQTSAVPIKLVTCFNCGKVGHRGPECKEQTMDDMNKSGKFQLNYNPVPKLSDCHE
ncbi:zinc finger CCHC domain-containing protein 2 [Caerostris darwini]|uniref:Zinc finger CCHC domain-containing protein 2 n=1 Tax=Caerostris darwini TaxID=1538125 RepID=A0AAV4PE27_9ARAC|nr:zinc finger CCHC domain-containing protein 2 [Caerostris darwini]